MAAVYGGGLECEPPAARPSRFRRARAAFQSSVWAPVALKLLALALGMIALAGVGIASILSGAGGVQVPLPGMMGNDINKAWLSSKPAASASTGTAGATSTGSRTSATVSGAAAGDGAVVATTSLAGTGVSAGMTEDGKVILNTATSEDLRHLPGVGAKRADAILALRARLGHFKHVNDLLRVKGIGVKGLKKILPHIVLDAPKPSV